MENITIKVNGDILTLTIDLSKKLRNSKSGKTMLIATTGGNQKIADSREEILGLNLYVKND